MTNLDKEIEELVKKYLILPSDDYMNPRIAGAAFRQAVKAIKELISKTENK